MILHKKIYLLLVLITVGFACTKKDNTITTTALAEFAYDGSGIIPTPAAGAPAIGSYFIANDPNSVYKIPIGITTVSNVDRTINYTVTSSTGAAAGVQYTIASNSIVIPAGKVVDSIAVKGIFAGYPTGRKDTLTFTITGGDVPVFSGFAVFKLVMQKYCPVVSTDLLGNYTNTRDYDKTTSGSASAAKYTASIANWTPLTATTASVLIKNLGSTSDIGFGPFASTEPAVTGLTATLNWSDPANFTVTLPSQAYVNTDLYGYGKATISGSGTFSSCDQTFVITYVVKVSVGSFTAVATKLLR
jgi:hypothetical protein